MTTTPQHCCTVDRIRAAAHGAPVYVYVIEGEPCIGTLDDYARNWEAAHYAGLMISTEVRRFENDSCCALSSPLKVVIEHSGFDADAYDDVTFTVRGRDDVACCRIDGRA